MHFSLHRSFDPRTGGLLQPDPMGPSTRANAPGIAGSTIIGRGAPVGMARFGARLSVEHAELDGATGIYQYVHNDPMRWTDRLGLYVDIPLDVQESRLVELASQYLSWGSRQLGVIVNGGPSPTAPPDPPPPYECRRSGDDADRRCLTVLIKCLEQKFEVPEGWPYGWPLPCDECQRECMHADGRWPHYKCPVVE